MKSKITYLWLSLLCLVGALSSCSNTPSASRLVPDDATCVLYFDVKELASQADYDGNDDFSSLVEKSLKSGDVGAKTRDKIMEIVGNPGKAGIDLSEPMLFFHSPSFTNEMAFVGAMSDADDFEEFLNALSKEDTCEKVREYSDMKYTHFGRTVVVFDDDYFGFTEATWEQREKGEDMDDAARLVVDEFKSLTKQKKNIADNDQFVEMCGRDGFFKVFVSGYGVSEIKGFEREFAPVEEQLGLKFKDYAFIATLNSDKGELTMEAEVLACNDKAQEFLDGINANGGPIKGTYLGYVDNNAILAATSYMNGGMYLKSLEKSGLFDKLGDPAMTQLVKDLCSNIEGDVTVQWTGLNAQDVPTASMYVASKQDTGIKALGNMLRENGMAYEMESNKFSIPWSLLGGTPAPSYDDVYYDEFIPDDYAFDSVAVAEPDYMGEDVAPAAPAATPGEPGVLFGWKQGAAYVVVGENPTAFAKPKTPANTGDYEGRRSYVRFNPAALLKCAMFDSMRDSEDFRIAKTFIDFFDYAEGYVADDTPNKVTLRVVMKDKENSPLKTLFDEWARLVKKYV